MGATTTNTKPSSSPGDRITAMRIVHQLVRPYTHTHGLHLLPYRLLATDPEGNDKPSVRAFFNVRIYQAITGKSLEAALHHGTLMKIAGVGEYCITLMYLENHYQDEKFRVRRNDPSTYQRNREDCRRTKAALFRYIEQQFRGPVQEKVLRAVNKLLYLYDQGMELDKSQLTYENFVRNNPHNLHRINSHIDQYVNVDEFLPLLDSRHFTKYRSIEQTHYLRLLLTRDFLMTAVFFTAFAELLIDCFGLPGHCYGDILTFARYYGMAHQLVNDNCDYVPVSYGLKTVCKLEEDTFSDMRRRLMTLPVLSFFTQTQATKGELFEHYSGSSARLNLFADDDQRWMLHQLKESGALGYSLRLVALFAKRAKQHIANPLFHDFFDFAQINRFYGKYFEFEYN